jgi:serine/threonine protein kinase
LRTTPIVSRVSSEATVLASLNHPNIAAIYGFEESAGGPALVLELVEGPTLADQLVAGPLLLGQALASQNRRPMPSRARTRTASFIAI